VRERIEDKEGDEAVTKKRGGGLDSYLQIETWLRGLVPTYRVNQTEKTVDSR
jgi:hypothetical protein